VDRARRDVVEHGHVGEQVEALEHHPDLEPHGADVRSSAAAAAVRPRLGEMIPLTVMAAVDRLERVERAEERRLAEPLGPITTTTCRGRRRA
jgi:hypothetical protein